MSSPLNILRMPHLTSDRPVGPCMVIGLGGWMDGGEVSSGAVKWLVDQTAAEPIATLDGEGFVLHAFSADEAGSGAAAIRPHVNIDNGRVDELLMPTGTFYAADDQGLLLFEADEPHMRWEAYTQLLLDFAQRCGVKRVIFVGSFSGMVPHTRQPRMFATVSEGPMLDELDALGLETSNYEGPCGFATYLITRVADYDLQMISIACELPPYVQGLNPRCIELVVRKIASMLELNVSTEELRHAGENWEKQITRAVGKKVKLTRHIRQLEEQYDHNVFHTQMPDLKSWLKQQGLRVD